MIFLIFCGLCLISSKNVDETNAVSVSFENWWLVKEIIVRYNSNKTHLRFVPKSMKVFQISTCLRTGLNQRSQPSVLTPVLTPTVATSGSTLSEDMLKFEIPSLTWVQTEDVFYSNYIWRWSPLQVISFRMRQTLH